MENASKLSFGAELNGLKPCEGVVSDAFLEAG